MMRWVFAAAFTLCAGLAAAEDAPVAPSAGNAQKPDQAPQASVEMSQVAVGDHWSYDLIDNISGEVKRKPTFIVTEITPNDITARTELPGSTNFGIVVYDRS